VTTPGYADAVGVEPTITADQLRGVVLACGPYDLVRLSSTRTPTAGRLVHAVMWAYSGKRRFLDDQLFATFSLTGHVTQDFPPALITVGNADPLKPHSELLVEELQSRGAHPETLFFPTDHEPPLSHEYQFALDTDAGQLFLDRMLTFLNRQLREPAGAATPHPEH
jgi:acetyl esterase/lipase